MHKSLKTIALTLLFAAILMPATAQVYFPHENNVQFNDFFEDATLRINYFREGCQKGNKVILSQMLKKNSTWAGSTTQMIDPINNGVYRIVVVDAASGINLYSRCYNTLFREYCDTPEGKDSVVRFEEVMNVPFPKQPVEILFQERDENQQFYTQLSASFDPAKSVNSNIKSSNDPLRLLYNGDPHNKIDVVIVAEGYGPKDKKKMTADFAKFTEYLLDKEPFRSRTNDFNVWGIDKLGDASGITNPGKNLKVNSAIGATYYTFGSARYLMCFNLFKLHDLLDNVPFDHIIIMANSDTYGGGAIYNFYAVSAVQSMSSYILPHELGHSIGGLADEYVDQEISYSDMHLPTQEPLEYNITSLVNFEIKWKDMLNPTTPVPTPPCKLSHRMDTCGELGVYEGGGYQPKGIYRPVMNCMMNYYAPFCPVCTKVLNAVFDLYTK